MFCLILRFITIGFLVCWLPMLTLAQEQENDLAFAIQRGSIQEISKYLDDRVEISFDTNKRDFSRNQAEIVLRDFFKNQPSEGFELQQKGQTSTSLSYLIGTYRSIRGDFRVLIRHKKRGAHSFLIYSIDFIRH